MPPNVTAVSADAIHFIDLHLIGVAVLAMALIALQTRAFHMNRVRKPNVRWLLCIDKPGNFVSRLDVEIHESRFSLALADLVGMASGAFLVCRQPGKSTVIAERMTFTALRDARFFRVGFMTKLKRLRLLHVQRARKRHPPGQQCDHEPKAEHQQPPLHPHSSAVHPRFEKKCWNKQTTC